MNLIQGTRLGSLKVRRLNCALVTEMQYNARLEVSQVKGLMVNIERTQRSRFFSRMREVATNSSFSFSFSVVFFCRWMKPFSDVSWYITTGNRNIAKTRHLPFISITLFRSKSTCTFGYVRWIGDFHRFGHLDLRSKFYSLLTNIQSHMTFEVNIQSHLCHFKNWTENLSESHELTAK